MEYIKAIFYVINQLQMNFSLYPTTQEVKMILEPRIFFAYSVSMNLIFKKGKEYYWNNLPRDVVAASILVFSCGNVFIFIACLSCDTDIQHSAQQCKLQILHNYNKFQKLKNPIKQKQTSKTKNPHSKRLVISSTKLSMKCFP